MSKKKKRRSSPSPSAKNFSPVSSLADETTNSSKRFDPLARNLLFGDLIFLAICQFLTVKGMMTDFLSSATTLIGLILLLIAIWIQFGKKDTTHYL